MFLQAGGGGKGIRPNQQQHHQQQQQQHQSSTHSHSTHLQQQTVGQQQTTHQTATHSHHPHQTQQHHHHRHQQSHQTPGFYTYQLNQSGQHQQQAQGSNAGQAPSPTNPTAGPNSTSLGSASTGTSSSTSLSRQHSSASNNIQHYAAHTPTPTGPILQQPATAAFMTTTYLQQQYHPQSAVMAAATAVAQYNTTAGSAGHSPQTQNTNTAQNLYQTQQQQQHQLHQTHHQTAIHAHYYHQQTGASPTTHIHSHHTHAQQHQLRGILTAQSHQRPQAYLMPNALFALSSGALTQPPPRSNLLTAHQQSAASVTPVPVPPLLQTAAAARNVAAGGGTATYIAPSFCQTPLPMGPTSLTQPPQLLATAASMGAPTIQTYGHMAAVAAAANASTSSTSIGTTENVKTRRFAIPIIHPITHENVMDPKPQKKSASVEVKPSVMEEDQQQQKHSTLVTGEQSKDLDKSKLREKKLSEITKSSSKEKIDQQMQTDAIKDKNAVIRNVNLQQTTEREVDNIEASSLITESQVEEETTGNCCQREHNEEVSDITPPDNSNPQEGYWPINETEDERIPTLQADVAVAPEYNTICNDIVESSTTGVTPGDNRGEDNNMLTGKKDLKNKEQDNEKEFLQCTEAFQDDREISTTIANQFTTETPTEICYTTETDQTESTEKMTKQQQDAKLLPQTLQKPSKQNSSVIDASASTPTLNKPQIKQTKSVQSKTPTVNTIQKNTSGTQPVTASIPSSASSYNEDRASSFPLPQHQQEQQQHQVLQQLPQQQKQKVNTATPTTTAAKTSTPVVGMSSNFNTNSKKNRKVTKRNEKAKENQKNREQTATSIHEGGSSSRNTSTYSNTLTSTNSNNNNNNSNYNNMHTSNIKSANILQATDENNTTLNHIKSDEPENSNTTQKKYADVRPASAKFNEEPELLELNNNSNFNKTQTSRQSKTAKGDPKCEELSEDTSLVLKGMTSASPPEKCTNSKTQDIFAQFLQPVNTNAKSPEELQLQFLNSSASACEDEEETNARLNLQQEHEESATRNLHFGDFDDEKKQTQLLSATSDLSPNDSISGEKSTDTTDSNLLNIPTKSCADSEEISKLEPELTQEIDTPLKKFKYSLEELKSLAKTSSARKPPLVQGQKSNCISQLFVSRQPYNPTAQHHGHNMSSLTLQQQLQQQYQHMDFTESLEYVAGKRRGGGQTKKHIDHNTNAVTGSVGAGGASGGQQPQRKMEIIRVHLSLKEEIKLSECENAWQPETLRNQSSSQQNTTDPNEDVKVVLKKVRGILNKLTPDNFDVLLKTMSSIHLNTQEKMQQVMLLVFEKTISEPNFAPTYAKFCKVLFHDIKEEKKSHFTNSLINRIQEEFESKVNDADAKKLKLQPLVDKLEACENNKERLELQAELEDQEYQFRRRAWGTVRFIGEMFKLQLIKNYRVLACIESLLMHGCEEKLEYMCKLLTTVGPLLESNAATERPDGIDRLNKIFRKIEEFVNKSGPPRAGMRNWKGPQLKISSRVRFMMQDVMDLRARNWDQGPQRPSSGSTTAKQEDKTGNSSAMYEKYTSAGSNTNRLPFGNNNQNSGRQSRQGGSTQGLGETHFFSKSSKYGSQQQEQQQQKQAIDINKLKFSRGDDNAQNNTTLGDSSIYLWRIAGRPTSAASMSANTSSTFPMNSVTSSATRRQTNPFHALDKPDKFDHEMNSSDNQSTEDLSKSSLNTKMNLTDKECQKLLNRLIEEILDTGSNSWQDEAMNTWKSLNSGQKVSLLHYILVDYLHLATVKRFHRQASAKLFGYLMGDPCFDKERIFGKAYSQFSEEFSDILVDVPNGWAYVFEFLGPLMHLHLLKFSDVWLPEWTENINFTEKFLKAFISYFTQEFGANYAYELWHKKYRLEQGECFFPPPGSAEKCRNFLVTNKLGHIKDPKIKVDESVFKRQQNISEQVKRIQYLLNTVNDYNLALDYINTNVSINANFIRSLTKFFCCDYATKLTRGTKQNQTSDKTVRLNVELFRSKCVPLLRFCLDTDENLEISCLDEVVDSLLQSYERDKNIAHELTCSIFELLYDCEIIAKESFEKWYRTRNKHGNTAATSAATSTSSEATELKMHSRQLNQQQQQHQQQQHQQNQNLPNKIDLFMTKIL